MFREGAKPNATCNVCNSFIMMITVARLRIINIDKVNVCVRGWRKRAKTTILLGKSFILSFCFLFHPQTLTTRQRIHSRHFESSRHFSFLRNNPKLALFPSLLFWKRNFHLSENFIEMKMFANKENKEHKTICKKRKETDKDYFRLQIIFWVFWNVLWRQRSCQKRGLFSST